VVKAAVLLVAMAVVVTMGKSAAIVVMVVRPMMAVNRFAPGDNKREGRTTQASHSKEVRHPFMFPT